MVTTTYHINNAQEISIKIALVADLHDQEYAQVIEEIRLSAPDMIAVVGDLMNRNRDRMSQNFGLTFPDEQKYALEFLRASSAVAPTFYSLGNHERVIDDTMKEAVRDTGAILLDNSFVHWNGIWIGGLTSAYSHFRCDPAGPKIPNIPDEDFLKDFSALKGFKILLSHHPEYYPKYISPLNVDLILSGHAHGGQWRIFGRGLYAPGQGILPKLTSGVHDDRLVISRGLGNTTKIPRLWNPEELVIVEYGSFNQR